MNDAEKQQQYEAALLAFLEKINATRFFQDSQPPFDREFVGLLVEKYGLSYLREKLNEIYLWILEDPDNHTRTNYRMLINRWLRKDTLCKCPNCGHSFFKK